MSQSRTLQHSLKVVELIEIHCRGDRPEVLSVVPDEGGRVFERSL